MRPGLYRALFASTTGSSCITGGGLGNENPRKKAWVGRYNYIILSVLFLVIGRAEGAGKMCTPGQFLENGVCTECPPNTYAPSAGMVECIAVRRAQCSSRWGIATLRLGSRHFGFNISIYSTFTSRIGLSVELKRLSIFSFPFNIVPLWSNRNVHTAC